MGTFQEKDFEQGGGHYRVVVDADPADYDMQKIVSQLQASRGSATDWMNDRPYQLICLFIIFRSGPAGGGMEHSYSTAIDINADRLAKIRTR